MNPVILGLSEEEQKRLQNQAQKFTQEELKKAVNLFMEAQNRIKYSSIPQLPLEIAVIDITLKEA